jgi:hypothetical protein
VGLMRISFSSDWSLVSGSRPGQKIPAALSHEIPRKRQNFGLGQGLR